MTPEQLEAHRVRFEQQYVKNLSWTPAQIKADREGNEYKNFYANISWYAYQWALADVDRAGRVAPGVQGEWKMVPVKLTDDMQHAARIQNIDVRTLDAMWHYMLAVAPAPPQQSAQPVAWACWADGNDCDSEPDVCRLEPKAYPNRKPLFYAAAQPVEVQQVPLTAAEIEAIAKPFICTVGGYSQNEPAIPDNGKIEDFVQAVEAAHGIKPTSSEGGKHDS